MGLFAWTTSQVHRREKKCVHKKENSCTVGLTRECWTVADVYATKAKSQHYVINKETNLHSLWEPKVIRHVTRNVDVSRWGELGTTCKFLLKSLQNKFKRPSVVRRIFLYTIKKNQIKVTLEVFSPAFKNINQQPPTPATHTHTLLLLLLRLSPTSTKAEKSSIFLHIKHIPGLKFLSITTDY